MPLSVRLDILNQIYGIYDGFSTGLKVACVRGCATCCTQNVTMTTVEGYKIFSHVISKEQPGLFKRLSAHGDQERFRPAISTNELAALCIRGEEPPDEGSHWSRAHCPFLSEDECLIYEARPFGCRCFYSKQRCDSLDSAVVDPFLLSVNTLFQQVIEHIDAGGLFGNMTDVLLLLESDTERHRYEANTGMQKREGLSLNRRVPGLLVPPDDQERIQPILRQLEDVLEKQVPKVH